MTSTFDRPSDRRLRDYIDALVRLRTRDTIRHANRARVLRSKRKLAAPYAELGSLRAVAHLHCRDNTVRKAIDSFGIPRRSHVRYNDRGRFVDALKRGLTVRAMADELGCQRWSIYRALLSAARLLPFGRAN